MRFFTSQVFSEKESLRWHLPLIMFNFASVSHLDHLISVMKTMFLAFFERGREREPNLESGRLFWRWLAGHLIPTDVPSFETQTIRPSLLHSGHFA